MFKKKKDENDIEEIDIEFQDAYAEEDIDVNVRAIMAEDYKNISLGKSILKEVWSWIKMIAIAGLTALFISYFVIINATVPTGSMENTIMAESRILGLRIAYMFSEPQRGDVVVFKYPLNEEENYVKRIIGLPGETVQIINGEIYIYDKDNELVDGPLYEPYLKEEVKDKKNYEFKIPEGKYLMLGDNRNYSADARRWLEYVESYPEKYGTDINIIYVDREKILGKVYFMYWHKGLNFKWIDGVEIDY
jgi:signal peptidase I